MRASVRCVCVCVSVCVCNNLQRFVGYLFLLVNCEADSIAGPGQPKWALSQITSVIACVLVPRRPHQDGPGRARVQQPGPVSDPQP